ncbi:hypothetical protein GRI62_05495 [Erythrobacter arachoides]|uniref:SH3b domain-containing protein n=1 Tax=Aurantiacibacter arachoides TaxID=1850444 RepID=A0A845A684_9SPHN|nr:SH3 domain-containing protein [Aurantiacibacter arachoides]MXO93059.1 hypothetical protein [Aurantiacibacter arachoides]GGD52344.1 hypothetical protein GCM10011411_10270 [Aurantiacibacter arachoides]
MPRLAQFAFLALLLAPAVASAQEVELPYWASISAEEARMRAGPAEQYPIAWVYHRVGLPVKVVRFHQGWRLVEEPDGTQGWIFNALLSRERTAIVVGEDLAPMRAGSGAQADLRWNLEPGVIGLLGECDDGWCVLDVNGHRGFVEQSRLWGAGEP